MEPLEAELGQLDAEYARQELEAAQPVTTRDYVKRADIAPFPGMGAGMLAPGASLTRPLPDVHGR